MGKWVVENEFWKNEFFEEMGAKHRQDNNNNSLLWIAKDVLKTALQKLNIRK